MDTKALLYGIIGFLLGGLIVSIAATTLNQEGGKKDDMNMSQMSSSLKNKKGDEFDKAYLSNMIEHHQGAIDMAELAEKNAKHQEIKTMSQTILSIQQKDIEQMKSWQELWGYKSDSDKDAGHSM